MANATSALRTPNTIWSKVIESNAAATKKTERGDSFLFFVGPRGSGKSTLLNRFLYPDRAEQPKPSEGLEYTFARKPAQYDHEKKDLAHIWEVGGSQDLATEIAQEEHIFLTFKQVTTAVAVVVVDLSDPATVWSAIQHWIEQVKRKLTSTYEKFEKRGLQLPEQLRTRAKLKQFNGHEDKDLVYHSGVSLVIVGAKYDAFQDQDPECKKLMARALRYIAHAHGAHLVYTGGLQGASSSQCGSGSSKAAAGSEKAMMDSFRMLLNHLAFNGIERKLPERLKLQSDHMGPLFIPAGQDHFRDIGRPRGGSGIPDAGALADGLREWQELLERTFPAKAGKAAAKGKFQVPDQYREEDVDTALREKVAELEVYRRQQAEAAETKKRALASRQSQAGVAPGAQQPAGGAAASGKAKKKAPSAAKPAAAAARG